MHSDDLLELSYKLEAIITPINTTETTEVGHYYYNFNSSLIGDQGYPQLTKNRLGDIQSSHASERATNQYIVLLKPAAVSASDGAILRQQQTEGEEKLEQQKDTVRMMAAQAAREGGQVTRVYANLGGTQYGLLRMIKDSLKG